MKYKAYFEELKNRWVNALA